MTALQELDTNARRPPNQTPPSEIWDEDFEFMQDDKNENMPSSSSRRRSDKARDSREMLQRTIAGENAFDKEAGPSKRPSGIDITTADHLRAWSESPISHKARGKLPVSSEENWDDDFVDKVDSPVRASHRRSMSVPLSQEENWDEDFEMGVDASPSSKRSRGDASWDSSDDEELGFGRDEDDRTVTQKSRRRPLAALNTDIPPVLPLPPYLPTIPSGALPSDPAPFPRSPTLSVFSIPTTVSGGRDSASGNYGSTLHLRRTHSAGSSSPSHSHHQHITGRFPPVSPNRGTRERRRLRKKSRPPHLESNIIELDDRSELTPTVDVALGPYAHMPYRPVTPENRTQPSTPPPALVAPTPARAQESSSSPMTVDLGSPSQAPPATSPPPKSPLFSRLGSVKRWSAGTRKKRASTGPSEVIAAGGPSSFAAIVEADRYDNNKTPRPHSSYIQSSSSPVPAVPRNKFFRDVSGTLGSKEEQDQTPAKARLSASSDASRESKKGKSRAELQVSSGEVFETGLASPRKLRIKAFGSKLISSTKPHSTDHPEGRVDTNGDMRMTPSPTPQPSSVPVDIPQTPSRLRPRLPPQTPSTSNRPTIFPRHVSASAAHDTHAIAPSPSARSLSTSLIQGKEDTIGQTPEKKEGSRGFMGSMRRISLVGGQKRHKRGKSGGADDMMVETTPPPPLPRNELPRLSGTSSRSETPIESEPEEPSGKGLLPALELGPPLHASEISKAQIKIATSSSLSVDIGSPVEKSTLAPLPRRPGEPTLSHSKSSSFATPPPSRASQSAMARLNASPSQAASLGRASQNPTGTGGSASSNVHRRNSLGDLKIPSRISRAQDGLKRDLTRVREFANHVEMMKELRTNYYNLATRVQTMLEYPQAPSRATSPTTFFNFSRPVSRARSNTNPPPPPRIDYGLLALSFRTIDSKYRIAWECAELLIDLGTGATTGIPPDASPPASLPTSKSDPASVRVKNRERAITLAGDEGKPVLTGIDSNSRDPFPATPPVLLSWRASTGRHDLNQRQLFLLKEMLNNAESAKEGVALEIPEPGSFPPNWRLGEGMESNLTLPTEESASASNASPQKKRPSSKLGMTGIRDMLRSLKRNHSRASQPDAAQSSTTLSTESSLNTQARNYENYPYLSQTGLPIPPRSTGRRRSKTSAGPDSVRSTNGDYPQYPHVSGISVSHKSSPRRPSLASLFRLGQKHKGSPVNSTDHSLDKTVESANSSQSHGSSQSRGTAEDEDDESDWDRMDSLSDVDVQIDNSPENADKKGTLKLRKKKRLSYRFESPSRPRPTPFRNPFSSSQASLQGAPDQSAVQILSTRLSNVDENSASAPRSGRQTPVESGRPRSRGKDRPVPSSVRSVPLKPSKGLPVFDIAPIPEFKLAMTPENIRPLLENARVVTSRLQDCVSEVKDLLSKAEVLS